MANAILKVTCSMAHTDESKIHPHAGSFQAGTDIDIQVSVVDVDGANPNYTNASVAVTLNAESGTPTATVALDTPAEAPQLIVTVAEAQTSSLDTPQRINCFVTITKSGGEIDIVGFSFDVRRAA